MLGGCTDLPDFPNKPLAEHAENKRPVNTIGDDADAPVVLIAFSGGGSRAAAVGLGVLDQLRDVTFQQAGRPMRLADRVKVVSSVSGGSVIAAWFSLKGPDQVDQLRPRFLSQDNMKTLELEGANPLTWTRLLFTRFTRIDAFRQLLDDELFHQATFADLLKPETPVLVMNATDMASGEVFAFSPQRFDDICSDLDQLPLSVGVASSAAFPVALSPMSLRNYSYSPTGCRGTLANAAWIAKDLNDVPSRFLNLEEYKRARYANTLRAPNNGYRDEHYLHLLDGGLADNQGVQSLKEALFSPHGPVRILDQINTGAIKSIVVITVNARSDPKTNVDKDPDVPGLLAVLNAVTGSPIDSATAYANAGLEDLIDQLNQAGADAAKLRGDAKFSNLKVYGISIDFDQFLPGQEQTQSDVKNIGTTWTLNAQQLDESIGAGRTLLRQHPCFQRLLQDLHVPVQGPNPSVTAELCPVHSGG
jgi:NTE family protein